VKHGVFGLPTAVGRALLKDPGLDPPTGDSRLLDLVGETALRFFDALGPIYGKAGQIALSRLSPPLAEIAGMLRLTRLYDDWPPLPFAEVERILDRAIPAWRTQLSVEPHPLGVASLAQVHGATDAEGRAWVVKVIKPRARTRLLETVEALEQGLALVQPLAVTEVARRAVKEAFDLAQGFRQELSLSREREMILRVREKLRSRRQKLLVVPDVHPDFAAEGVLVVERFHGTSMADVVSGKVPLPAGFKARLAKSMLAELLVQVFELGLFHADPHAGNLILTDDGAVGLFDWGLTGELLDSDRRHIAAILRAVITVDLEALIDALVAMGEGEGKKVPRESVRKELKTVIAMVKKGQEDPAKKPSLDQLFEHCLRSAARLGIAVPDGLLMMAKALITIEGLARGIDPKVSLPRVAGPVLFRAARPGIKELWSMGRRMPAVARQLFGGGG
jgi:ubiquinone biosynthesis protein